MLDIPASDVTMKGRLGPGMMICVNLETGEVMSISCPKNRVQIRAGKKKLFAAVLSEIL